jgi:hypothetical protein
VRRFEKVFVFARRIGKRANKKWLPSFTSVVVARPIAEINL